MDVMDAGGCARRGVERLGFCRWYGSGGGAPEDGMVGVVVAGESYCGASCEAGLGISPAVGGEGTEAGPGSRGARCGWKGKGTAPGWGGGGELKAGVDGAGTVPVGVYLVAFGLAGEVGAGTAGAPGCAYRGRSRAGPVLVAGVVAAI